MGNGVRAAYVRLIGLPVCMCLLAGCGGGGGGGGNSPPPNAAPTIQAQAFSGTEDVPVAGLIAASDPGDTFTFSVVTNPARGALTSFASSGQFTYTPAANFNGEDTFQVQVTDSRNQTATATMRVTLAAVNDPPVAANDVLQVTSTNALTVLTNDVDLDGDTLAVEVLGTPMVGVGSVNADGTVALTLPPGFKGFTKFDYRIVDAAGVTAQATAQVFVGIAPFSVFYHGAPAAGEPTGIYLNDLFANRLVHPPLATPGTFENLQVSADGSALVYVLRFVGELQVWYVDIDNLGVQRPAVNLTGSQQIDSVVISPDGRYVATVVRTPAVPDTLEVFLFDAQSTAPASRISLDLTTHLVSWEPKFNEASTALYYLGHTGFPGESAVYKADLSTRSVTRVTPVVSGAVGVNYITFWISPDESRILHYRSLGAIVREFWVTPGGQPDVQALLHEPSVIEPFYPSIAPNFDAIAVPVLNAPHEDRLKLARLSSPGTTVAAGPVEFLRYIHATGQSEVLRWRHDSGAFLTCSGAAVGGLCRVYEAVLSDLDHPRVVNAPIGAQESATNGAYSSDGERISYVVEGLHKRELHVTTPTSMGVTSTLVSPAGQYLSSRRLDPSGRVAIVMTVAAPLTLVNLDAPGHSLTIAEQATGISYLEAIAPRRP